MNGPPKVACGTPHLGLRSDKIAIRRASASYHRRPFEDYLRRRSGVTIGGNSMLGALVLNSLN